MEEKNPNVSEAVLVEKEKTKRSTLKIVLIVGAIAIVPLLCCGGLTLSASTLSIITGGFSTANTTSDASTKNPAAPQKEVVYSVGDEVVVEDLKFKVTKVTDIGSTVTRPYLDPIVTQGTFIRIDFEVENLGKEGQYMGGMEIIDSQERIFSESDEKYSILSDDAEFFDKLNPNVKTEYSTVFDVAKGAKNLKLKVKGFGLLNSKFATVDLGISAADAVE